MPLWAGVYEAIANGNLGLLPTSAVGTIIAVGPCSGGLDNTPYYYDKSSAAALRDELGGGDLVDRLLDFFALSGNQAKAIVVPAQKDIAGQINEAEQAYSSPDATFGGSPTGAYQIDIEIVTGGAHETATFRYSIDGGDNWSGVIATPAQGVPYSLSPTGVTVSFGAGTFVAEETYAVDTISPSCSLSSLLAALNVAKELSLPFEYACVFTPTSAASWNGLGTWGDDLFAAHRSCRVLTEAPLPTDGETAAEYVTRLVELQKNFGHDRVSVTAATAEIQDLQAYSLERGISGLVAGLIAASPVQRSIGSTRYCKMTPILRLALELEEAHLKTLNEARYIVPRQYVGLSGWYVNDGNVMADATSDFRTVENCRVMDNAIRNVRATALKHVHSEVDIVEGVADPAGQKHIEGDCQSTLNTLRATFSSARIEIPEGQDILVTSQLDANISIVPKGYNKKINLNFALVKF